MHISRILLRCIEALVTLVGHVFIFILGLISILIFGTITIGALYQMYAKTGFTALGIYGLTFSISLMSFGFMMISRSTGSWYRIGGRGGHTGPYFIWTENHSPTKVYFARLMGLFILLCSVTVFGVGIFSLLSDFRLDGIHIFATFFSFFMALVLGDHGYRMFIGPPLRIQSELGRWM